MKKVLWMIIFLLVLVVFICFYPRIEFYSDNYLYMMSYGREFDLSEDFDELEDVTCYDESYSYNKKRDISIKSWEYKGFLFFKWFKVSYEKGNVCETEFLLKESYIQNFLENAVIVENDDNIDLAKLINGKEAIVSNKRYSLDDNHSYIGFVLDGSYKEMFVSKNENLIIIQVGLSDEGPKYIVYR